MSQVWMCFGHNQQSLTHFGHHLNTKRGLVTFLDTLWAHMGVLRPKCVYPHIVLQCRGREREGTPHILCKSVLLLCSVGGEGKKKKGMAHNLCIFLAVTKVTFVSSFLFLALGWILCSNLRRGQRPPAPGVNHLRGW